MSDFARKQLLKYGWCEGKGLGKKEDGISKAIKPVLKFNNHGIGHDSSKEFTDRWWDYAFNKAAKSLKIVTTKEGVKIKKRKEKKKIPKEELPNTLPGFVKAEMLPADGIVINPLHHSSTEDTNLEQLHTGLNDEELFKICGGRTAHKAARYGLKMSGKLKRIQDQDFISQNGFQLSSCQSSKEGSIVKHSMKRNHTDEGEKHYLCYTNETSSLGSSKKHKKKKNKK